MPVSGVTIRAPADGVAIPNNVVRPAITVGWTDATNTKQIDYTWDTDPTFNNSSGVRQQRTYTAVAGTEHTGVPLADLGLLTDGTVWYLRATVTDEVDLASGSDSDNDFTFFDPKLKNRYLYAFASVGVGFGPGEADGNPIEFNRYLYLLANVGVGFGPGEADGNPIEFNRYLYLLANVGVGFGAGGSGSGYGDGDPQYLPRFLYLLANVDTTQPCPFIETVSPSIAAEGDGILISGQGLVNADYPTADPWNAAVRLYETPSFSSPYVTMPIVSYTAGDTQDTIQVTVPTGVSDGFLAVVHTAGTPSCDGSNFKFLQVTPAPEVDSGWVLEAWNVRGTQRIVGPIPALQGGYEELLNDVGEGWLDVAPGNASVVDLFCDPKATPPVGSLIKVFIDGVERYSFLAEARDVVLDEEQGQVIRISGPGREIFLDWTIILPHDYPANPTTAGPYVYGSLGNLLVNGDFEGNNLNPITNGFFEQGDEEGWDPYPEGQPPTQRAWDGSIFRTGSGSLRVLNLTAPGQGVVTQVSAPVGEPIQDLVAVNLYVRDAGNSGDTIAAVAYWVNEDDPDNPVEVQLDSATIILTTEWKLMSLSFFAPTTNPSIYLKVINQTGTTTFYIDDAEGWYSTKPWRVYHGGDALHLTQEEVLSGRFSAKVTPEAVYGGIGQTVTVTPNEDLRIIAAVAGTAGDVIEITAQLENSFPATEVVLSGLPNWSSLELTATASENEETILFWIRNKSNANVFYVDDVQVLPGKKATSPGGIVVPQLESAHARGQIPWISWTFTEELDAHGEAWEDAEVAITFNHLESLRQLIDRLVAIGPDWDLTSAWRLDLVNRLGHDLTALGDQAPVLRAGPALAQGGNETRQQMRATWAFIEGKDGLWTTAAQPTLETNIERREVALSNPDVNDQVTLGVLGNAQLDDERARRLSTSIIITRNDEIRPYQDFNKGDYVWVDYAGTGKEKYRVRGFRVTLSGEGHGITYVPIINHVRYEILAAQAAALKRLLDKGTTQSLSPGSGTVGTVVSGGGSAGGAAGGGSGGSVEPTSHAHRISDILDPAVGGDLTGALPNPIVAGLRGRQLSPATPEDWGILHWNPTSGRWEPSAKLLGKPLPAPPTATDDQKALIYDHPGSRFILGSVSGGGGGGAVVPAWAVHLAEPDDSPTWADEFAGSSLDPAWTTVLPTGSLDVTVKRGLASLKHAGGAANDCIAIVRDLPSFTSTLDVEFAWRLLAANRLMAGPVFARGDTPTDAVIWMMNYDWMAGYLDTVDIRSGTFTNVATDHNAPGTKLVPFGPLIYTRFRYDTTSGFRQYHSPDGVRWIDGGSYVANPMGGPPTKFGFGLTAWGTAGDRIVSLEYARAYADVPAVS